MRIFTKSLLVDLINMATNLSFARPRRGGGNTTTSASSASSSPDSHVKVVVRVRPASGTSSSSSSHVGATALGIAPGGAEQRLRCSENSIEVE